MEEDEAEELGCGFVEDRSPRLLRSGNDDDDDDDNDDDDDQKREEHDEIAYVEEGYLLDVQIRRAMRELQAEAVDCNPALVAEQFRLEMQQALAGLQPCKLLAHHHSFLRAIRAKDKAKARERATHFVYQPLQPEELMVDDLLIASNELRALRCVEVYGCHLLSSEAYLDLTGLAICNKLVSMQLYSVPGLHGHGLLELIKLPSLRSFKATGCSNIYDPDIIAVAKQLAVFAKDGWQRAKLRELTLSNTKMTIVGFHALMSAATGILELGLSDNAFVRPDLQAECVLGSFEKNSTVGHLDLSRCVGAPSVLTEAILSCRFLQQLVLQAVPAVTDDLIRIVSCSCLHLTHLVVRDCVVLSDEAVLTISTTATVLLDIRGCPNISAAAVANLLELRSSLQDPAVLVTVLHDFKDAQGDLWLSNQARAQRALGIDAPIPTFAAETVKPPPAPTTTSTSEATPAAGDAAAAAAPTKKRKFTLKASIPSKKPAMASASAADSAPSAAQDAPTIPSMLAAAPISNPVDSLWSFLQSKVASCDQLWPVRLEIGSLRESFTLPSWHVFRFMSSYQLMPAVVLPDALRRAGAYVLMERPEYKYILCSQTALKYPWCNKTTGEPVWFDIKFEPISHKALRDAVQLLSDSLRACMNGNDLPLALGFASWTEVWWANSLQRLRIGWRESDDMATGVDVVPRLEPLPQDPEAAFHIVSADQGMVLRDVDGKVCRLASKAVLDFVLSQESNPT